MKISYRRQAYKDLEWFRTYYTAVFPQGAKSARKHYNSALKMIEKFPMSGRPAETEAEIRELLVANTPFSIAYTVGEKTIDVVRVYDNRAFREKD
jgi:plasmid stabilization system protein ParE